jgi:hypothetical protein
MVTLFAGSAKKQMIATTNSISFRNRFLSDMYSGGTMAKFSWNRLLWFAGLCLISFNMTQGAETKEQKIDKPYLAYVQECLDTLMQYGTDRYGAVQLPILVSILDVESRTCPENPEKLDEYFRVTRRGRRNPAGSNLLADQPLLKTMYLVSSLTGAKKYAEAAARYSDYVMKNLVDEKGFFWWGLHRHYDVYKDVRDGHNGNYHEIQAMNCIGWDQLWAINPQAVQKEIEAIWQWHVIDKNSGEINRHGDGKPGCDFSMSAGAFIEAFCFLYGKTQDAVWLERAKRLANYYWNHRDKNSNCLPERPNAGTDRFDGASFTTAVTGLYCHSLLKAFEMTREQSFRDQALTYLKAFAHFGYDKKTGRYWGAMRLDGTPIPGPRVFSNNVDSAEGYEAFQPRGHMILWQPYIAGYEHPISTAQIFPYAYQLTADAAMLKTARRFAHWIRTTPPGTVENEETWFKAYTLGPGKMGTYADLYGRAISFFVHLYALTGDKTCLQDAQTFADEAVARLYHNGLFRGHPAKPYYEAIDGVGFLLYALVELDEVLKKPSETVKLHSIRISPTMFMAMDNW